MGYPSRETFYQKYTNLINEIQALQPNAIIYVSNIIPVNDAIMKKRGTYDVFNNQVVAEFNTYIHRVASEKNLVYLDLFTYFQNDEGQLPAEASGDGLHLNGTYCKKWADYLRWHTVEGGGATPQEPTPEPEWQPETPSTDWVPSAAPAPEEPATQTAPEIPAWESDPSGIPGVTTQEESTPAPEGTAGESQTVEPPQEAPSWNGELAPQGIPGVV